MFNSENKLAQTSGGYFAVFSVLAGVRIKLFNFEDAPLGGIQNKLEVQHNSGFVQISEEIFKLPHGSFFQLCLV